MERERWRRLKAMVVGALELEEGEREDWLRVAANGDLALVEEARNLLEHDEPSAAFEPGASADWILE